MKVILQLYPMIHAASEEERERLRPIGRNRERYQETLTGMHEIVKAADRLGLWGVASIEHHFWSEGYEVGPHPGLLDAYWAAITKNIRVGQLGYVMSTQHPIRVAEETAIIDHLTQGRCFVGFARGYQSRWTNVVGQHLGTRATTSPSAAAASLFDRKVEQKDVDDDDVNRRIFEEEIDVVLKAWTEESIEHNGPTFQIPFPFERGVDDWMLAKMGVTGRFGAHGEVDEAGNVRRISVVPAPYTKPHPPVFVATSGSPESAKYAASHGFIPLYFTPLQVALNLGNAYQETAVASGSKIKLGQNQAMVRITHIAKSKAAAEESVMRCDSDIFRNFYTALSGRKIAPAEVLGAVSKYGLWAFGTADDVRKQLVEQWKQFPAEYLTLIYHYAQMPKEEVIANLETFMREVKPALDEVVESAHR